MKVLNEAGVEKIPESLGEFKEVLKAVKSKTDAVPLCSNARGGTELKYWNSLAYTFSGELNSNLDIINKENLFSPDGGGEYYNVYKFLYECVRENLIEDSFVSSKWDGGITGKNGRNDA